MTLKGLPYTEQGNYVDKYGKLAEMFPYKEITSSAEGGPEHEVVAVNEIVRNRNNAGQGFVPQYDSMALVGLTSNRPLNSPSCLSSAPTSPRRQS